MKTAIAYVRVSTDLERQKLSDVAQRHAIEQWAVRHDVRIVAWYTEEVSGGDALADRPVLMEALAAVAAHKAQYLVVKSVDRYSRDPLSAALAGLELERAKATVAIVDGAGGDDPASELVRNILVAVGKFERQMIGIRVRAALAVKKRSGEVTGQPRYGFRKLGKESVADDREVAILDEARRLRAKGLSLRKVITGLTSAGMLSRTGKPFSVASIHQMLRAG